ncbi:MAG: polymerase subunit alpha, partial [Frondihabitans sp.]|nr:polymerase subunit alpha [Frondihabitans sp.]
FLTVADVSQMMRDLPMRTAARVSGTGSLITYLLRISTVEPILGPTRETLPEIHIDVESARRDEVDRAIFDRYGTNRVALVSRHPDGVILGDSHLLGLTPVQPSTRGLPMSQFDEHDLNDVGLVKLDILGVPLQSSMAFALDEIERINSTRAASAGALPIDAPYVDRQGRIELDAIPREVEPTHEADHPHPSFDLPTYQSAWLKAHYPAEFLAGTLTHDPGRYPKHLQLTEAGRMGIPVLPLDVNTSDDVYHVERIKPPRTPVARTYPGELGIRLSLVEVQGITGAELQRVVANRPYTSITDFHQRATPSRRLFERLGQVGALDSLGGEGRTRGDVLIRIRQLTSRSKRPVRADVVNQLDFAVDESNEVPTGTPDVSTRERVSDELDVPSMEVSEHVVESYRPMLDDLGVTRAADLLNNWNGTTVLVAGIRIATQTPPMRSGKRVVFISLDDGSGCSDSTFFEEAQNRAGSLLFGTRLMLIRGRTRRTGERGISLEADNAWDLKQMWRDWKTARLATGAHGDADADLVSP